MDRLHFLLFVTCVLTLGAGVYCLANGVSITWPVDSPIALIFLSCWGIWLWGFEASDEVVKAGVRWA